MSYQTGRIVWHDDREIEEEDPCRAGNGGVDASGKDQAGTQYFSVKDLNWDDSGKLVVLSQVSEFAICFSAFCFENISYHSSYSGSFSFLASS